MQCSERLCLSISVECERNLRRALLMLESSYVAAGGVSCLFLCVCLWVTVDGLTD